MNLPDSIPPQHPALSSTTLAEISLKNQVAVAPLSRVSTQGDGIPTKQMVQYYATFAQGEFGLIITEGTYTDLAYSQSYPNQVGIATDAQVRGWQAVTDAVHAAGGKIFVQLMHAGALPQAMTPAEIREASTGFAQAALNAKAAGFDGIEIHGANGYLIDQFITDYTNQRTDNYGGDIAHQIRFAVEVIKAVRAAVRDSYPVGIRLSQTKVNDFEYRWSGGEQDGRVIFAAVKAAGIDFIHIASEGRDWLSTAKLAGDMTITQLAKQVAQVPIIANGGMHCPEKAAQILEERHGDIISLGLNAIANPDWPLRLAQGRPFEEFDHAMIQPDATLNNIQQWLAQQAA